MSALVLLALGGMLIAGGVVLLLFQLRPAPPHLSASLAQLVAAPARAAVTRPAARTGNRATRLPANITRIAGRYTGASDADLRILEMDRAQLAARAVLGGVAGLLVPASLAAALSVVGHVSPALPALFALLIAVVGWLLPGYLVRQRAARARQQMRDIVPAFATEVRMRRGAGSAPEDAMKEACRGWRAWQLQMIYAEIQRAQLANHSQWSALHELGESLQVAELRDLADIMTGAGDGAAVIATLDAEVRNLRHAQLAEDKAEAKNRTERLVQPGLMLLAGYILMLLIPPMMRVFG